ncbi:MAG: zinc ribbon domain-containing protein [Muribaculaceae bacterium]|nr:zinc ribbon domain-containing protein [Muribaculaceae bacterium]
MKECKNCGTTYDDSVKFCGECGQTLDEVKNEQDRLGEELAKSCASKPAAELPKVIVNETPSESKPKSRSGIWMAIAAFFAIAFFALLAYHLAEVDRINRDRSDLISELYDSRQRVEELELQQQEGSQREVKVEEAQAEAAEAKAETEEVRGFYEDYGSGN